jgi:hypothetical protein
MDVLSVESFKYLAVIPALLVGVLVYFVYFRDKYWALASAVFAYTLAVLSVGLYILSHATDPRWSGQELVQAPKISDTPIVGKALEPLGAFLNQTADSINYAAAFEHAFPVAWDFFTLAFAGLIGFAAAVLVAMTVSKLQTRLMKNEVKTLKRQNNELQGVVSKLTKAVNEQRAINGLPPLD